MTKNIPTILTVKTFAQKHDFITEAALRNLIFYREKNEMNKFNVLSKLGKKILINEEKFFEWLEYKQEVKG